MRLSPSQAVKAHCQECLGLNQFNRQEIEACQGDNCFTGPCPLFPYRLGRRIPVKVFRSFCKHCMGGNDSLIKDCPSENCKIYPYRFGKNPSRQGIGGNLFQIRREPKEKGQESMLSALYG